MARVPAATRPPRRRLAEPVPVQEAVRPPRHRIAVLSHSHPSVTKGGAEISAYTLYRGLRSLGHDAVFIAACPQAQRGQLSLESDHEFAIFHDPRLYDHVYNVSMPSVVQDLCSMLTRLEVGVVNFHHFLSFGLNGLSAAANLPGTRTLLTLHEFLAICQNHGQMITTTAAALCDMASLRRCHDCFPDMRQQQIAVPRQAALDALATVDGFVSPSRFLAGRYVDWGLPPDRMHVIENGLGHRAEGRAATRSADSPHVFGFFGQINPFKGVDTLLQAVELLERMPALDSRIRIRIHGNLVGQSEAFVQRFTAASRRSGVLTYTGPYDNATVGQLMTQCDYVLVPSSWWENSPVVIQEAFNAGRPVICTGIGGMAEKVVDGVSGLHFRIRDAQHLVEVMAEAIKPETHARLLNGIPTVIDARIMAEQYSAVFGIPAVRPHASSGIETGQPPDLGFPLRPILERVP